VNLPEVRWKAANGMAEMGQKVYRHLIEQRWRTEGALDLLMERLYQMHVIPDILPNLRPTVDLRVVFPEAPPKNAVLRARAKRETAPVEAGVFLVNEQVCTNAPLGRIGTESVTLDAPPAKALHHSFPSGAPALYLAHGRSRCTR